MGLINPLLYKAVFLHFAVILSIAQCLSYSPSSLTLKSKYETFGLMVLSILLSMFLGFRPISGVFGDTVNYAAGYSFMTIDEAMNQGEWCFYGLMAVFNKFGFDINAFFFFVDIIYIMGNAWICKKVFPGYAILVFAVTLASFSFFSYGVNGIRQGMASALIFFAMTSFMDKKWMLAVLFSLCAYLSHSALILLPAAGYLAYKIPCTKLYFKIWIACLILGLFASEITSVVFENIGLVSSSHDLDYYNSTDVELDQFSHSGFRWDFLLYGCIPVLIGYYFVVKRNFRSEIYTWILNIYIIVNSFWAVMNQSWLSNRIAYLSWFMYAIVMMYPLLYAPDIPNRKPKVSFAVLGNAAFTYLMFLMGKYS